MRRVNGSMFAVAAALFVTTAGFVQAQDVARPVAGGGITAPGWTGKIDPSEERAGAKLDQAKFAKEGDALHATTGPAVIYWNPANTASGNYTVKATFREPKFMGLNDHPHPYGIVIAGNDLGTGTQSYLYCAAYGTGNFIVRGFGPVAPAAGGAAVSTPFQLNGRRGEANAAVKKAAGPGEPVTQEIAVSVSADKVECAINGTVVGSYPKADVVTAGRLKSTDGVYGLRFGHNTEAIVTGLAVTKN